MKRSEIVKEAEGWAGTKWQHQQARKQVACDCIDGAEPAGAIGSKDPGIRGAAHAGFLVGVR